MLEAPIEFNGLTFNNQSAARPLSSYWIRVATIDGLFGDEIQYETHPIPCGTGERSATVTRNGKSIVLTGEIFAANITQLRTGQWALAGAFWDLTSHRLLIAPAGAPSRLFWNCKVNQPLVMADEITEMNYHKRNWTVGLRADDPRSYREDNSALWPTWQT